MAAEPIELAGLPTLEPHGPPPPPSASRFVLAVQDGEQVRFRGEGATRIPVDEKPLLLGRRDAVSGIYPDVDLQEVRDYGYTSRQHAEVHVENSRIFVTDLKGLETTAINDLANVLPKDQPTELHEGDRLIIGEAVTFVVLRVET